MTNLAFDYFARSGQLTRDGRPNRTAQGIVEQGWLRTTANTGLAGAGVSASDLTDYVGSLSITGTVYRKRFNLGSSGIINLGPNAVLDECEINGSILDNPLVYLDDSGGGGQIIRNCDLNSSADLSSESKGIQGWNSQGFSLIGTKITGTTTFVWLEGNGSAPSLIDQCYFYNQVGGASHHDGFTRRNGTNPLIIQNTRIDTSAGAVTGAFFLQSTYGNLVSNVTVQDCYLEGMGYCFALETSSDITITRNRIRSTGWGPAYSTSMVRLSWSENYVYVNDAANDYKGVSIGAP